MTWSVKSHGWISFIIMEGGGGGGYGKMVAFSIQPYKKRILFPVRLESEKKTLKSLPSRRVGWVFLFKKLFPDTYLGND